jgi:hypothetical protein
MHMALCAACNQKLIFSREAASSPSAGGCLDLTIGILPQFAAQIKCDCS